MRGGRQLAFLISCNNSETPYFIKPERDMETGLDLVKRQIAALDFLAENVSYQLGNSS